MGASSKDEFGQINFGAFLHATGHSYPNYLKQYATPLQVLAENDLQPRQRYGLGSISSIESSVKIIEYSTNRKILSVATLSAISTPRTEFSNADWSNGFSIIVGDSFVDRVTFWNGRSLFPKWRDGEPVDICLPSAALEDVPLIEALAGFLARRNFATDSGHGRIVVRSATISDDRLDTLVETLTAVGSHIHVTKEKISSVSAHVPSDKTLETAYFAFVSGIGSAVKQNWEATEVSDQQFTISPPQPEHLRFCPPGLVSPHAGCWAVDLLIGRSNDLSLYSNVGQHWVLPRRLRITSAFRQSYELAGSGAIVTPRISIGGCLCLFANGDTQLGPINVPTDEDAIRYGYVRGRDWWPFRDTPDAHDHMPVQAAAHVERSGNGRYFWGVLDMFGGLRTAQSVLLHAFWLQQFERMGATQRRDESRRTSVVHILQKRLKSKLGNSLEESLDLVADHVLAIADGLRARPVSVNWNSLRADHDTFIDRYWKEHPPLQDEDGIEEWRENQRRSLEPAVQRLCELGVLHQGFESKCYKCLHRTWIPIDGLSATIECEVCRSETRAPISRPWEFRMNEFLREALRAQGILPLFWALHRKRHMREQSFYFEGPLDIYLTLKSFDANERDTDVDLSVLSDGAFDIIEAKSSSRHLRKATDLAALAKRLRPDVATIAVMEEGSEKTSAIFREFSELLKNTGIIPNLLTLRPADIDDDPSLSLREAVRLM